MKVRVIGTNYLRSTPPILTVGALIYGALASNCVILWYGLLAVLFNALNLGIKRFLATPASTHHWMQRPTPCPADGCGEFVGNAGIGDDTVGMPSGHAQFVGMFATFFSLFLLLAPAKLGFRGSYPAAVALAGLCWLLALLVMLQRLGWGTSPACHTPLQVASGFVLGVVLGAFSYVAVKSCAGASS